MTTFFERELDQSTVIFLVLIGYDVKEENFRSHTNHLHQNLDVSSDKAKNTATF